MRGVNTRHVPDWRSSMTSVRRGPVIQENMTGIGAESVYRPLCSRLTGQGTVVVVSNVFAPMFGDLFTVERWRVRTTAATCTGVSMDCDPRDVQGGFLSSPMACKGGPKGKCRVSGVSVHASRSRTCSSASIRARPIYAMLRLALLLRKRGQQRTRK
jgi:hypothetical protein